LHKNTKTAAVKYNWFIFFFQTASACICNCDYVLQQ